MPTRIKLWSFCIEMETNNTVFSCLKPYFCILKILGLFPYNIKEVKSSKILIEFSETKFMLTIVALCIPSFGYIVALKYASAFDDLFEGAVFWKHLNYILNLITLIQIMAQLYWNSKIVRTLEYFMEFNNKIFTFGLNARSIIRFQKNCCKIPNLTIIMTLVILVYSLYVLAYSTFYGGWQYSLFLQYGLSLEFLYGCFNVMQFIIFSLIIEQSFICLTSFVEISMKNLSSHKIDKTMNLFNILHESINVSNESLSELLTPTIAATLVNEVLTSFFVVKQIFFYEENFSVSYVFTSGVWIFFNFLRHVLVCYAGASVKSSMASFKQSLLNCIVVTKNELLRNELRCMLFQMECGPKYLENSIFVVDWSLTLMVGLSVNVVMYISMIDI